jgi:hypothetical protein
VSTATQEERSLERAWWLRLAFVLQSPRAVFAELRDDSDQAASARQEPVLAVTVLAGIGAVLMTSITGYILDDFEIDHVVLVIWAFLAGALHGLAGFFAIGALLFFGLQAAGSVASYRRARHLLAFACAPLALSLVAWPIRLALYGEDSFTTGGSDSGTGGDVFEGIKLAFLAWSAALLVIGVRAMEKWSWPRSLGASSLVLLVPVVALGAHYGVV